MASEVMGTAKHEDKPTEGTERTRSRRVFRPRTDIIETDKAILIVADMPGVDENSTDIRVEKHVLSIEGRVNWQMPVSHQEIYSEYEVGDYHRAFTLSEEVDADRIEAQITHGVLRLTLPKAAPPEARRITVKAG